MTVVHPDLWQIGFRWVDAHVPPPTLDEIVAAINVSGEPIALVEPVDGPDGGLWLCRLGLGVAADLALLGHMSIPLGTIMAEAEMS